jgi:uncharacterized protein (TIGR02145 family)
VDGSGMLTDSRDGKRYKTAVIGGNRWMGENLKYQPQSGNSWCYDNSSSNCDRYGRLYDWRTARTICPAGFHLPLAADWDRLALAAGGKRTKYRNDNTGKDFFAWDDAGKKFKARSGWNNRKDGSGGNGTDAFGFSALPGGLRNTDGNFNYAGNIGFWWTASECGNGTACDRDMRISYDYVREDGDGKDYGFSVRCIQD